MASLTIKQCAVCKVELNASWNKPDDRGNYICPFCGYPNTFSDNAEKVREEQDINKVLSLLDNTQFQKAAEELSNLRSVYPKSSKVYFLSVLADNCVCYTKESKDGNRYIPTLNDLPSRSLLESAYAKKALELEPSELVKESYKQVFDYIEKVRLEILEAANNKDNQYDVFISTKVKVINNGRESSDEKTPDYQYANDLYNYIRGKYPDKKVFFSESYEAKTKMAGNKYENYIYAALHSAKAFILVAESRENIEWRWVRNEWMRYLMILDREKQKTDKQNTRHFVLFTHNKTLEDDLPYELKGFQLINSNLAGSTDILNGFLEKAFNANQTRAKLEAKQFSNEVEKVQLGEIEDTFAARTLKTHIEDISNDDIKAELERIAREMDPSRPSRRLEAFSDLEALLNENPNVYEAQKMMLLKDTNYYHFEDYIGNNDEVMKNPEIASKFFEFAAEEDAKKVITKMAEFFTSDDCLEKVVSGDFEPKELASSLDLIIMPYLDSIDKKLLKELVSSLEEMVNPWCIECKDEYEEKIIDSYLSVAHYMNGKDPLQYIAVRRSLLESAINHLSGIEEDFAKILDDIIEISDTNKPKAEVKNNKLITKLVKEIMNVNPSDYETIWLELCFKYFGKTYAPDVLTTKIEKGNLTLPVVGNKETIDIFKTIFKYSKGDNRKEFLLAFLTAIIYDEKSYLREEGQDTLSISQDVDNNGVIDDEERNGLDLFNQYIGYELPGVIDLSSEKALYSKYGAELKENSPLLSPNIYAYFKKQNPTYLDKLLCIFAVKMHENRFYDQAVTLYETYLAQQDSIKTIDCVLIRYYKELAGVRIAKPEELKRVSAKIRHKDIFRDLVQLEKTSSEATVLLNKISDILEIQDQYLKIYQPIKDLANQLPRESSIDKIPIIHEIKEKMLAELNQVSNSIVRKELEDDFSFELDFFKNKLPEIENAKKTIDIFEDEAKTKQYILNQGSNLLVFDSGTVNKLRQDLLKIVETYDNPALIKKHTGTINRAADSIIGDRVAKEEAARAAAKSKARAEQRQRRNSEIADAAVSAGAGFLKFLQVLLYLSPVILSVVFGIILFANNKQISIISGAFAGWVTGWLFFTVVGLILTIVFMKKRFGGDWEASDGGAIGATIACAVVSVIAMIIGISGASHLDPSFDPPTQFKLILTGVSDSTDDSYYYTTFKITLENHCPVGVDSAYCELKIYTNSYLAGTWTTTFSDNYTFEAGETYHRKLDLKTTDSTIYYASYEQITIKYRFTQFRFSTDYQTYDFDGSLITMEKN